MRRKYLKTIMAIMLSIILTLNIGIMGLSFAGDDIYTVPKSFENKSYKKYLMTSKTLPLVKIKTELSYDEYFVGDEVELECVLTNRTNGLELSPIKIKVGNEVDTIKNFKFNTDFTKTYKLKFDKAKKYNIPVLVYYNGKPMFYKNVAFEIKKPVKGKEKTKKTKKAKAKREQGGPTFKVGDRVWYDENNNGLQDVDEVGMEDIRVTLYNYETNEPTIVYYSDPDGSYLFDVPNGNYTIAFESPSYPEGFYPSPYNIGNDDTIDSDGHYYVVQVNSVDDYTLDFGLTDKLYDIGDSVWHDENSDGIHQTGEPGIQGVKVTATNTNPQRPFVTSDISDVNGAYELKVPYGEYEISFDRTTFPDGYYRTKRTIGSDTGDDTDPIWQVRFIGSNDYDVDLGLSNNSHTIGNRVWDDQNGNGIQDEGEPGIQGIGVEIYDDEEYLIETVTTNANGYYQFNYPPGVYTIKFKTDTFPGGYYETKRNVGDDEAKDSDGINISDFDMLSEDNTDIDLGLTNVTYSIGDYVWDDVDNNGIQNSSESGVSGVVVKLLDKDENLIETATTNANGYYSFENVKMGQYFVEFDGSSFPSGYSPTLTNAISDTSLDSGGLKQSVNLYSNDTSIDLGINHLTYEIGNLVWNDLDGDGIQDPGEPGIPNVEMRMYNEHGDIINTVYTDSNGQYLFTEVENGTYRIGINRDDSLNGLYTTAIMSGSDRAKDSNGEIVEVIVNGSNDSTIDFGLTDKLYKVGNYTWIDANSNGIQETSENPLPYVQVVIAAKDYSAGFVKSTFTDENGNYEFENIPDGEYRVAFDEDTLPEGYYATARNKGSDASLDSNGLISAIYVNGENNYDVDFGVTNVKYVVSTKVWEDLNANGIKEITESTFSGVEAKLYASVQSPETGEVSWNHIDTKTTNSNGDIEFNNLKNQKYKMVFNKSTYPASYGETLVDVGGNLIQSNDGVVEFEVNGENTNVNMGLSNYIRKIGDRVWDDTNFNGIQDEGESGVAGVTVKITKADGSEMTTTTDSDGKYEFKQLSNDEYTIEFSNLPAGYIPTDTNIENDQTLDSNGLISTVVIQGADNYSVDLGICIARDVRTTDKTNLYDSIGGNIVATVEKNQIYTLKGSRTEPIGIRWYKVEHNGSDVFLNSRHVSYDTESEDNFDARSTESVNVRDDAWGAKIGTLGKNIIKTVYGYRKDASGNKWYRISFNGGDGYVASDYLSTDLIYYVRTTETVNVRSTPGGTKVGTIGKNIIKTVYGQSYQNGDMWLKVWYNGGYNYIYAGVTSNNLKYYARTKYTVNVRSTPGGTKVGTIGKNIIKTVYGQSYHNGDMWLKVWYNGGYNYIYSGAASNYLKYTARTKYTVNVRSTPGGTKVGTIGKNIFKTIYGQTYTSSGSMWLKVWYNGGYNYIYSGAASNYLQYNVKTTTTVDVRTSPEGDVIGTIPQNTIKTVYGQNYDDDGDMWLKIWFNGSYKYIDVAETTYDY